jgi:hypothetical protein
MNKRYIIQDWAGNHNFSPKTFKSFDDADKFLTQYIEKTYPETAIDEEKFEMERGEYYVVELE